MFAFDHAPAASLRTALEHGPIASVYNKYVCPRNLIPLGRLVYPALDHGEARQSLHRRIVPYRVAYSASELARRIVVLLL